jgi:DNA-binding NarL/FixJ family response regulator
MNSREYFFVITILSVIALLVGIDVTEDLKNGVTTWHLAAELAVGAIALGGLFYLLKGSVKLKNDLRAAVKQSVAVKTEAEAWRAESRKYIDGLSKAIDDQLTKWELTAAEKEVAFLLLKGLSLKEIAEVRKTSERTARAQSIAIYSKSGVSGRSALAAFFLEDLLAPKSVATV